MRTRTRAILFCLIASATVLSGGQLRSAASAQTGAHSLKRIRFQIAAFAESAGRRDLISEATVEGPQGTDFNIKLQAERFELSARFLTDLAAPDVLKIRARLNTRRFYGYSERNLPLYEEDDQQEGLQLGFDEKIVLLPFGRNDSNEQLKIEITPALSLTPYLASGKVRPLEIKLPTVSPGGAISVEAFKLPHNFTVEATLLEDGIEVARGTADCLIAEARELVLRPTEQASPEVINNPLAVNLTINQYTRSRPADLATIGFDIYRTERQSGRREITGLKWAGVGALGAYMSYDLSRVYLPDSGRKYELKFKIKLAQGEQAD